jgi:hypothetical protein
MNDRTFNQFIYRTLPFKILHWFYNWLGGRGAATFLQIKEDDSHCNEWCGSPLGSLVPCHAERVCGFFRAARFSCVKSRWLCTPLHTISSFFISWGVAEGGVGPAYALPAARISLTDQLMRGLTAGERERENVTRQNRKSCASMLACQFCCFVLVTL